MNSSSTQIEKWVTVKAEMGLQETCRNCACQLFLLCVATTDADWRSHGELNVSHAHFHIRVGLNCQKTTLENASILLRRPLDPVGSEQRSLESPVRGFDVPFGASSQNLLNAPVSSLNYCQALKRWCSTFICHNMAQVCWSMRRGEKKKKGRAGESKRERQRDEPARQLLPGFKGCPSP